MRLKALFGCVLLAAATLSPTVASASTPSPQAMTQQCITNGNCSHRATLAQITRDLKGYHYGPRRYTHWVRGKIAYFTFARRHGHRIAKTHARAKYLPPLPATRLQPQGGWWHCTWDIFDSDCFGWNYGKVWNAMTGGDSLLHTVQSCADGVNHGFVGNLSKAEAGTLLFYTIGTDITDVPILRATPAGLAVTVVGRCVWGIWENR